MTGYEDNNMGAGGQSPRLDRYRSAPAPGGAQWPGQAGSPSQESGANAGPWQAGTPHQGTPGGQTLRSQPNQPLPPRQVHVPPPPPGPETGKRRKPNLITIALISIAAVVLLFLLVICGLAAAYVSIAADLPSPEALRSQAASFVSTRIYDRNGYLLYEIVDPTGGRRVLVPYEQMSPHLINATVATEDERFWHHPGVDPIGIIRAVIQNIQEGEVVSGASTIPQTLVDVVFLTPEERMGQTLSYKIREAVLAAEISRRYTKREIIEIYLNEVNFGNLAYGVEAAAETYFGKSSRDLDLAEASMLAGLPQAPAYWDPYTNWEGAKRRQAVVLGLMVQAGYISQAEAEAAKAQELPLRQLESNVQAPHFVIWIQQLLEQKYGADVLYRSGLKVTTTLDSRLQDIAQEEAQAHLRTLEDRHATNAALVALKPDTGEVLAMLGSADFNNAEIDGQVNVTMRLRQPGSSIKPVTYVTAFEKGWTPSTVLWDVETEFVDALGRPYVPKNYDRKVRGPVLVREALAQSLNIPAVKTLDFVGLPAMLDTAHRLGINSLNRPDYGLSLTLGGGDVTLMEMAGAYAVFANGGKRVPPVAILRIEDATGRVLEEYRPPEGEQVISPQHAYLITDILSDNQARAGTFGPNSALKLSRPAAAKTGTTDDWRDSWTMGYTPELVAGVWVGNSDNTAMKNVTGSSGAGPIWHNFMERALAEQAPSQFARPDGIDVIEISADSGSLPSEACPPDRRRTEIFAAGQGPLGPEYDFHQLIEIDLTTNALATEYCPAELVEKRYYYVLPGEEGQKWAQERGIPQPPETLCPVHGAEAPAILLQPAPGETVFGEVYIGGRANLADFDHYIVEYGVGRDPIGWGPVAGPVYTPVDGGLLAIWNVTRLENQDYTLRVLVYNQAGNAAEARTWVWVQNATPTPTTTPTPTGTATPTPTLPPTPTYTPSPTATPTPSATPTPIDLPTVPPPTSTAESPTATATGTSPTSPPP